MSVETASKSVQVIGPMAGGLELPVSAMPPVKFSSSTEMRGEIPKEFKSGGIYALENMPLADSIPLERNPDSGKKMTAIHELQHALVGTVKGNELVALSVNPEGATLGWTLFKGVVDPPTAAAGSVDTVFGPASGFSGDLATIKAIDWMNDRTPGQSISSAQEDAKAIIARFDQNVLSVASEIIALKGYLTAEEFDEVIRRAEFEVAWQQSGFDLNEALGEQGINYAKEYLIDGSRLIRPVIPKTGTYTLIEILSDKIVTSIYQDGKIKIQTVVCPRCGAEGGGHLPSCEAAINRSTTPIPTFEEFTQTQTLDEIGLTLTLKETDTFPTAAVIFSD